MKAGALILECLSLKMKGGVIECWSVVWLFILIGGVGADCTVGCQALAYYRVNTGDTADSLTSRFQTNGPQLQSYNRNVTNLNSILAGTKLFLPFDCQCTNGQLVHNFAYKVSDLLHTTAWVDLLSSLEHFQY